MKNQWLITFRSVTFAQKGEKILKQAGVECILQRTPKELSRRGCGYCLRLRGNSAFRGAELLHRAELPFEKVYALSDDGHPEERML